MNERIKTHLREQVAALPNSPGVYRFVDSSGRIIYVGKAKSLKKRVSSYFIENRDHSAKIRVMIGKIADIHHTVVNSEQDALFLENSLIKELQPRYNTLLKDDKTYPWITITNEPFPRIVAQRNIVHNGTEYFGPYGSKKVMYAMLDFIHKVAPIRICNTLLTEESIAKGKYRDCLQYHLHRCKAPCVGRQSREEYNNYIAQVRLILKGNIRPVMSWLEEEMMRASSELRFEDAEIFKQRIYAIKSYQAKSVIVSSKIIDCDVFTVITEEDTAFCNFIRIRHGSVIAIHTLCMEIGIDSAEEDILSTAICHVVESTGMPLAPEVLVTTTPSSAPIFDNIKFHIPRRGEKLELINFSLKSAEAYRAKYIEEREILKTKMSDESLMAEMMQEIGINREPRHMECFDNSNIQGTDAVASCVVFRNGKPSRKEYRHFKVKSVEGANDFATMYEIISRRYQRVLDNNEELPDLIVVDGGKGQLSSACMALKDLGILDRVNIIGLAKRIEEVFFPNNPKPLYLNRFKRSIKVLCHIRDEAHRFAITFHRATHRTKMTESEFENIKGIGEKSRNALLKAFKSIKVIEIATEEEIAAVVGKHKAKIVKEYFANK